MTKKEVINLTTKQKFLELIEKQKEKELPLCYFLLINLHHLFYKNDTKNNMRNSMTISKISELIYERKNRPDVQYLLKYLVEKGVLVENKSNPFDDRKTYTINKNNLRKEIDSWRITKAVVDIYLSDCRVNVTLEK
jgi:hypothetical protein